MADQKTEGTEKVVDFNQKRAQKLDEKRRKTERIFFQNMIGCYSVIGDRSMRPIEILDVSEDGCSFQVPFDAKNPWPAETVEIPIAVTVRLALRVNGAVETILAAYPLANKLAIVNR